MDWFFDQFLFHPGHAVFEVTKEWSESSKTLKLEITQVQDKWDQVPIYRIPVNIGLYTAVEHKLEKVWLENKTETFEFKLESEPLLVRFDEGNNLLKEWSFNKPEAELIYQAKNDDMIGRMWAVNQLEKFKESNATIELWTETASNDNFWAVREAAIQQLSANHNKDFIELFSTATNDPSSKVRLAAVSALGNTLDPAMINKLREIFETDESYLVMAEALNSLGKCGNRSQFTYLKDAGKVNSHRNVIGKAATRAIEMINDK